MKIDFGKTLAVRFCFVCALMSAAVRAEAEQNFVTGTNSPAHVGSFVCQARLKTVEGTPIAGSNDVTFTLWNAATDGQKLWARVIPVFSDRAGLATATLSDGAGLRPLGAEHEYLDEALAAAEVLYLGVSIGAAAEIRPRQRLTPVPFAGSALNVAQARGNFTTEETLAAAAMKAGEGTVQADMSAQTASVSGELRVNGNLNMLEGLNVTAGKSTFKNELSVAGGLTVSGTAELKDVTVKDTATVQGMVTAGSLAVSGAFMVGGVNAALPKGVIICWNGNLKDLPRDWEVCDGSQGTPDLRDYFVPAAGSAYQLGEVGGADTVKLEERHLPSHSHSITFHTYDYAGKHNESSEITGKYWDCNRAVVSSTAAGGSAAHENRPPYYALYYIMKVR